MESDIYELDSLDGLLTAVSERKDQAARQAMSEYLRIRMTGETPIVDRHPQRGWRVRELTGRRT